MPTWTGSLNNNLIFESMKNMIINQLIEADNLSGLSSSLVDKFRVEGSLYGDTILYYDTDALESKDWIQDSESAINVLELHRPKDPDVQAIVMDVYRQIAVTTDAVRTKNMWMNEGSFGKFNSILKGWLTGTKKVYDVTTFNSFIGTAEATSAAQNIEVELPESSGDYTDVEAANRLNALYIGEAIANVFDDMKDVSRDFNDNGNLKAIDPSDMVLVFSSAWKNAIRKVDLPTVFNEEGVVDRIDQESMNKRYFGEVNTTAGTTGASNSTVRSLIETDYGDTHVFPGDLLPGSSSYDEDVTYTEDPDIICKIVHKGGVPYFSAYESETQFVNARNHSENTYLTFGHNTLELLKKYPFITIKKK